MKTQYIHTQALSTHTKLLITHTYTHTQKLHTLSAHTLLTYNKYIH